MHLAPNFGKIKVGRVRSDVDQFDVMFTSDVLCAYLQDAGRLSICDACGKLYVGRRRDQLGCSRRCGDTLYMRRYRNPEYRNRNKSDSKRRQIRKALNALRRKRGPQP